MAWWTHLLFFGSYSPGDKDFDYQEENRFAIFRRVFKQYIYDHFVDLLYVSLGVFTYIYLLLSIVAFFFYSSVPRSLPHIIDTLSEPYLGSLGIYVVVKEIERRRGKVKKRRFGDLFAVVWFIFFLSATALTYFSEEYGLNEIYKTVVTNSLAALIIRIGTLLR